MTQPQTIRSGGSVSFGQRPAAMLAVAVGRILARLPPRRIRAVLMNLRRHAAPATAPQVQEAHLAVLAVSVLCGGRYCLQRSLAVAVLCRLRGYWPTWCTGVRMAPFVAHAWVEVDGQPVAEPQDAEYYRRIIVIPPAPYLAHVPCQSNNEKGLS